MKERFFLRTLDHDLHAPDGERVAAALSQEDAAGLGGDPERETAAPVLLAGECTSTFDAAWLAAGQADPPSWSAVIALCQSRGRGQLRREWVSPPGNLYVSFFLPREFAELDTLASLATGYCIHAALGLMGISTRLKWPNDLLLEGPDGRHGKFGGLLLEEREGRLLAGLGLNLLSAPETEKLRPDRAVPAVALARRQGDVCGFWCGLVQHMRAVYVRDIEGAPREVVREKTERALAWRGERVRAEEPDVTGELAGINEGGSLLLRTNSGLVAVSSGSIAPE